METTPDTENTLTLLERASFQLPNTIFPHSQHHRVCIFMVQLFGWLLSMATPGTWLVMHISVVTAEMHANSAQIHCLVSIIE